MGLKSIELIKKERERQISEEGWTAEHDDEHINGELVLAAICYAFPDLYSKGYWPWGPDEFKPTTKIKDLIKADALISAEIDRLLRLN